MLIVLMAPVFVFFPFSLLDHKLEHTALANDIPRMDHMDARISPC